MANAKPVGRFWRIIVPVILGGAILTGAGIMLSRLLKQRQLQEYLTARDVIYEQMEGVLDNPGVLQMAATHAWRHSGNAALKACILGGSECRSGELTSFAVYDAISGAEGSEAGETQPRLLAGPEDLPAYYSAVGKPACDGTESEPCPGWQLLVWFRAKCPDGAAVCARASELVVRWQVRGVGGLSYLPAVPPEDVFKREPDQFVRVVRLAEGA